MFWMLREAGANYVEIALAALRARAPPAAKANSPRCAHAPLRTPALAQQGVRVLGGNHPALGVFVGSALTLQPLTDSLYESGVHVGGCAIRWCRRAGRGCGSTSRRSTDEEIGRVLRRSSCGQAVLR